MAIQSGITAPKFKGIIENGSEISLQELKNKWLVLYFYPKDNTSGCTLEACDFRDNMERITSTGAVVIGVSPDSVKSHQNFIAKHGLNFHLISDENKSICNAYDVYGEKTLYGKKYLGVIRSSFVITPNGKINKVFSPVSVNGHVDEIMKYLAEVM